MAKKKKPEHECKMQFARTVARTGKWRGVIAEKYTKYKKKKRLINKQ